MTIRHLVVGVPVISGVCLGSFWFRRLRHIERVEPIEPTSLLAKSKPDLGNNSGGGGVNQNYYRDHFRVVCSIPRSKLTGYKIPSPQQFQKQQQQQQQSAAATQQPSSPPAQQTSGGDVKKPAAGTAAGAVDASLSTDASPLITLNENGTLERDLTTGFGRAFFTCDSFKIERWIVTNVLRGSPGITNDQVNQLSFQVGDEPLPGAFKVVERTPNQIMSRWGLSPRMSGHSWLSVKLLGVSDPPATKAVVDRSDSLVDLEFNFGSSVWGMPTDQSGGVAARAHRWYARVCMYFGIFCMVGADPRQFYVLQKQKPASAAPAATKK